MIYYKTSDNKLIQFNPETGVYKQRNITGKTILFSKEEVLKDGTIKIKKEEFSRLMNIYFKSVKDEWIYNGVNFKKIDNFESSNFDLSSNYKIRKRYTISQN